MKKWILLFAIMQFVLFLFIIASLSTTKWVETEFDFSFIYTTDIDEGKLREFDCSKFQGGLLTCHRGYKVDTTKLSEQYLNLYRDICTFYNEVKDRDGYFGSNKYSYEKIDDIRSVCKMLKSISSASTVKILCDILSMIGILIWFIGMLCLIRSVNCFNFTYICSLCSLFLFYIGSIMWFVNANATFGSCLINPVNGDQPKICATHGPAIVIFITIIFPIIVILYIIITCKAQRKRFRSFRLAIQDSQQQINYLQPLPKLSNIVHPELNGLYNQYDYKVYQSDNIIPEPLNEFPPAVIAFHDEYEQENNDSNY